jgi:hypothetical protein
MACRYSKGYWTDPLRFQFRDVSAHFSFLFSLFSFVLSRLLSLRLVTSPTFSMIPAPTESHVSVLAFLPVLSDGLAV